MATFFNQASMSFGGSVTNSNITSGEVVGGLTLTKTAITTDYRAGDGITYLLTITNNGETDYTGITLTDNLGAYTLPDDTTPLVPLTYVDGTLLYYKDGVLQPTPEVLPGPPLTVNGLSIPKGSNAIIVYEARANSYAPLSSGSEILNTASIPSCDDVSESATVSVRDEAILTISKTVCPEVVTCAGEITYTFIIQNTGNTAVVATDSLTVSDTFNPTLSNITVTLNGEPLTVDVGYTYNTETGEFTTLPGAITVPAATYARDPQTGVVTTTPGFTKLTVSGTI